MYYDSKDPVFYWTYRKYTILYHATDKVFFCNDLKKDGFVCTFDSVSAIKKAIDAEYKESKCIEIMFDPENPGRISGDSKLIIGKITTTSPRLVVVEGIDGKTYDVQRSTCNRPKFLTVDSNHIEILKRATELEGKSVEFSVKAAEEMTKLKYVTI